MKKDYYNIDFYVFLFNNKKEIPITNITDIVGDYEACIIGHHKTKVNYMLKIMPDSFCLNILGQDYDIICTGRLINKKKTSCY